MQTAAADDPVLRHFRSRLNGVYGDRLDRVILFGSRARGDHHDGSDYDVAVFLRDIESRWTEFSVCAEITTDIPVDTGAVISSKPKTHKGAHIEFARLTEGHATTPHEMVASLSQSYSLKTVADCEDGAPVTSAEAKASLDKAARLVDMGEKAILTSMHG